MQAATLIEQIDALTDDNRARNDPGVERELVRLRHCAFPELDRESKPPAWPAVAPASPMIDAGIPEIEARDLTAGVLSTAIWRHGCLCVRGLLSTYRAAVLVDGIDRAMSAAERFEAGTPVEETMPWFEPFRPDRSYSRDMKMQVGNRRSWVREAGGVWTADSPHMLFEYFETLRETGLADVITEYLGERPALAVDKATLRRVGLDTGTDWHQDGAFLGTARGIHTVNVWMALSRCGRDAPGLDVVPCRLDDIVETGTHGAEFRWSVGPGMVEKLAVDHPVLRPQFEPGDALLFDDVFLHRTAIDSVMTRERYAIETWFFAPSTYPDQYVPLVA